MKTVLTVTANIFASAVGYQWWFLPARGIPEEIDLHEASGPVNVGRNNVMCKNIFPQPYNFKALFTLANKLARQNFIDRHVGSTN